VRRGWAGPITARAHAGTADRRIDQLMPEKLHILFYEYVEDVGERRAPHREGHLALIKRWHDEGRISIAGGVGDPPHAGLIVLREDDLDAAQAAAEEFVAEDPYQPAGLVTSWRVEPFLNVTA
jgi:uncharacterized protein